MADEGEKRLARRANIPLITKCWQLANAETRWLAAAKNCSRCEFAGRNKAKSQRLTAKLHQARAKALKRNDPFPGMKSACPFNSPWFGLHAATLISSQDTDSPPDQSWLARDDGAGVEVDDGLHALSLLAVVERLHTRSDGISVGVPRPA